ncbi:S-adenosyl-L-methionine-dependent methyltransferase [Xylariaceae sp. FL0662B]|nr:S-adenosyl-L-methionine-dependent methyltransferase [Xylariaceae sp. FL0662B]
MAPQKSVSELASLVKEQTVALENETKASGSAAAYSLAYGTPSGAFLPPALQAKRADLLELVDDLRAQLLGPMDYIVNTGFQPASTIAILHAINAFGIASHVPLGADESITYEELAARCGLPVEDTHQILQAAIAFRIFEDAVPDVSVRHNAVSATLNMDGVKDIVGFITEEIPHGTLRFVESLRRWPGTGEPGHTGFAMWCRSQAGLSETDVADPTKGFFDYIANDQERVARFHRAMGFSFATPAFASSHFVENLAWANGGECPETIVDIAGSSGALCHAILRRYEGVKKAVVLDLPEVVSTAEVPGDLAGRLEFEKYNFLTEKVTRRADAYVFRHILHDWSDEYATKILRNLVPALRDGSRIWLNEIVLPDVNEGKHLQNQWKRSMDLIMKQGFNAKERSRRGWEKLFREADKRFRIESIVQPKGATDAVIGVVFKE